MFLVLAASAAISLVTLFLLLLNPSKPHFLRIPSAFLGGTRFQAPLHLRLTRPPWLPWLFVVLATAGGILAYCPAKPSVPQGISGSNALVWVDNSFSSVVSGRMPKSNISAPLAEALANDSNLFLLTTSFENAAPGFAFAPQKDVRSLETEIKKIFEAGASPFARPLAAKELETELKKDSRFSDGRGILVVISDGQAETLQNLNAVRDLFREVRLVALPEPNLETVKQEEFAPNILFTLWREDVSQGADIKVLTENNTHIPPQARPGLMRSVWPESVPALYKIGFERRHTNTMPMFSGCSMQLPGPLELDTFSDLRGLAGFFQVPFRMQSCRDATERSSFSTDDPWRYRMPSIWVVQTDAAIFNTLAAQGKLWFPEGFDQGTDALVYVAGASAAGEKDNPFLSQFPVQLDAGTLPQPLYLMPPPPGTALQFPDAKNSSATLQFPSAKSASVRSQAEAFQAIYLAGDTLPLGYRAGKSSIFYLRTTVSMPNGELGRSASWTQFWFQVAAAVSGGRPHVRELEFSGVSEFQEAFAKPLDANSPETVEGEKFLGEFPLQLNPENYIFENSGGPLSKTLALKPALYSSLDKRNFLLVSLAASEMSRNFLSPTEWAESGGRENSSNSVAGSFKGNAANSRAEFRIVFGAFLAVTALFCLWLWPVRKKSTGLLLTLLCFGTLGFSSSGHAERNAPQNAQVNAQGNNPLETLRRRMRQSFVTADTGGGPRSLPFRVGYCDTTVPPAVAARYESLRNMLAARGTIQMPTEMVAGGCRPGASEIWWTDSPGALNPQLTAEHVSSGGVFVLEGASAIPAPLASLADPSIGLTWESPQKRGVLYRSFYLLSSFDGCVQELSKVLSLRKKINAHSPVGIVTNTRMISEGGDCFVGNEDMRSRSFVNLMYGLLATDYKEDQLQLPEILNRVRNLGLEP